jgi:hypothetical protein
MKEKYWVWIIGLALLAYIVYDNTGTKTVTT